MAATRTSSRAEASRSPRSSPSKYPSVSAVLAHQRARQVAKEVGAPRLPLFYAPKRLKTYASRGVNSFKAPNPSLTRFSLPEESEVVYPDDTPLRNAAKRGFSAVEASDETGSPKRRKVDSPSARPPTPRSGVKRDFAQVAAGGDDQSPAKRQKLAVTDDDSDSNIDENLKTLSPIKKEELEGLIRECSKQSTETEAPIERPPLRFLVRGSQRQQPQSVESQTVEPRTPVERPPPRFLTVRRASITENQRPETQETRVPVERPAPSYLTVQRPNSTETHETRVLIERAPPSYLVQRSSTTENKSSTERPFSNYIVPGSKSLFQQKEEPSSDQAEATLPAHFSPVSRKRRTRTTLKKATSSSTPLSPSLPTRSPEAPEAPQASQDRTATSAQPIELPQGPAASHEHPTEPPQEPAVALLQAQELAPAHVQPAEIPRQQLLLATIRIMMAITVHFWNIATFVPRLLASRVQAAPVINFDPANDGSAVGQDASVNRVIPGAFPAVDDAPLPLNNDRHQRPLQDDDDDWTVRYRPSNGVTNASTDANTPQHNHESTQAFKVEELQSRLQALQKEKLVKEQEIATKLKALEQENMAKDQQILTIKEQILAIKDLQKKVTDLEQVYQAKEQQNLVIKELQSTLVTYEQKNLAMKGLQARLKAIEQEHLVKDQQNLATHELQWKLKDLEKKNVAQQKRIESLSRKHSLLKTTSEQRGTSKRYSDQPEEWRLDDAARRQLHHESFDANYEYEKDRILAANKYRYTTLTVEESEQCTRFATLTDPSNSARVRHTHKDPRAFFDNEDEVSLATSFARTSLAPSSRQLVSDSADCATREEEERRLEQQRRREAADAKLKPLGLRTPRAPVILELPGGEWASKIEATLRPGWPETGQKTKTCGPESIELGINDFKRMVPDGVWLNDSCIQAAVQYTAEYVNDTAGVTLKKDTPKCVGLNSFFWPAIVSRTVPQKKRMLKRLWGLTPENFLDVESIIIPINANAHWTFLLIRPQRREIAYVDSFHSPGQDRIEGGLEFVSIFLGPLYKADEWSQISFEVPLQTNGYDCGMFVITNSLLLALGLDPSGYKQSDMEGQRRIITAMILNGGWHGPFDLSKL